MSIILHILYLNATRHSTDRGGRAYGQQGPQGTLLEALGSLLDPLGRLLGSPRGLLAPPGALLGVTWKLLEPLGTLLRAS